MLQIVFSGELISYIQQSTWKRVCICTFWDLMLQTGRFNLITKTDYSCSQGCILSFKLTCSLHTRNLNYMNIGGFILLEKTKWIDLKSTQLCFQTGTAIILPLQPAQWTQMTSSHRQCLHCKKSGRWFLKWLNIKWFSISCVVHHKQWPKQFRKNWLA